MRTNLLYRDRVLDHVPDQCDLGQTGEDLGLEGIVTAMSHKDRDAADVCRLILAHPLTNTDEIRYRQEALADALANPRAIRELYATAQDALTRKRDAWSWLAIARSPSIVYSTAAEVLQIFVESLTRIRQTMDAAAPRLHSEAFTNLLATLDTNLDDTWVEGATSLLKEARDTDGMLVSAQLGPWNQGIHYVLRSKSQKRFKLHWALAPSFTLAPRDEAGGTDLGHRRNRAVSDAGTAMGEAAEHLNGFFLALRQELSFYVGCLDLAEKLDAAGMPTCIPEVSDETSDDREVEGLYDVGLSLAKGGVVGNDLTAQGCLLHIVTGANQGGKSTFLRSIGQAQIMAQCGMPIGATRATVPIREAVLTHFPREEDRSMRSGRLDEELGRMDELVGIARPRSLMLLNESFASTNEREGSEICRQVTTGLVGCGIEVFSVTHLYTYATGFEGRADTQFLRACRGDAGERSFKIVPGAPSRTAYGEDIYRKVFGIDDKGPKG